MLAAKGRLSLCHVYTRQLSTIFILCFVYHQKQSDFLCDDTVAGKNNWFEEKKIVPTLNQWSGSTQNVICHQWNCSNK